MAEVEKRRNLVLSGLEPLIITPASLSVPLVPAQKRIKKLRMNDPFCSNGF
jgi:uncharacterized membrane protein (GlpM family)